MFRTTTDTGGLGRGRDQSDEGLTCHHEVQSFRVPRSRGTVRRRGGLGTVVRDPAPEGTLMERPPTERLSDILTRMERPLNIWSTVTFVPVTF